MGRLINNTTMTVDGLIDVGCGGLARDLASLGLVDELRFRVHPALGREGTRPFGGGEARLRLVGSTSYDSGVTCLRYEPVPSG